MMKICTTTEKNILKINNIPHQLNEYGNTDVNYEFNRLNY